MGVIIEAINFIREIIVEAIYFSLAMMVEAANFINASLDIVLPYVAALLLICAAIYYIWSIRAEGLQRCLYLGTILLLEEVFAVLIIWFLPIWIAQWVSKPELTPYFRWLVLSLVAIGVIILISRQHGGLRGLFSASGHLSLFFIGWYIDRWMGIIFVSGILLAIYYYIMWRIAMIVVPASRPEDQNERRQRFLVLLSYTWGLQMPLLVVGDPAGREIETRISGDFTRDFRVPGFVWTRAHQTVGITAGVQFSRVDGPGLAFTGFLERPFECIDLRTQLRTTTIDAVSKDGIPFKAVVFTAFAVDKENWSTELYNRLRWINPLLRGGRIPNYRLGSYPFSHSRIRAVLSTTGVNSPRDEQETEMHWNDWVISQVEEAARQVLSQRDLDQLWRIRDVQQERDRKQEASALNEIAGEIRDKIATPLMQSGIRLFSARVVNYLFSEAAKENEREMTMEDKVKEKDKKSVGIVQQQIATWSVDWERQRAQVLAEGEAEAQRLQQEARAYAHSLLLTSVAEGMQRNSLLNPQIPRYVIAMRFVGALEELIRQQPEDERGKIMRADLRRIRQQIIAGSSEE